MTQNIRSLLAEQAKKFGVRMPEAQLLLAQERFLARLYSIPEGRYYVWKGWSLVLRCYNNLRIPRYTIDIDLLAKGTKVSSSLKEFKDACELDLKDNFQFRVTKTEDFERDTPYGGVSHIIDWKFQGKNASRFLKIDVCAGDHVDEVSRPVSNIFIFPKLEDLSAKVYPPEYVFAEKLETAVHFGTGNTRFKDFVDLWNLCQMPMDSQKLVVAIEACFSNRKQQLSKLRIKTILSDKRFQKFLSDRILGNPEYTRLELPSVSEMFKQIILKISDLHFK